MKNKMTKISAAIEPTYIGESGHRLVLTVDTEDKDYAQSLMVELTAAASLFTQRYNNPPPIPMMPKEAFNG